MQSNTHVGLLRHLGIITGLFTIATLSLALAGVAQAEEHLELRSSTFTEGGTLPLVMIADFPGTDGQNSCTASGAAGGDESPELTWKNVNPRTRSFVVIVYDETASFTHWGMYNISAETRRLPLNAGVTGSGYGTQIENDFGDLSYDGPCPPATLQPFAHRYVFTVYALDITLKELPTHGEFAPGAEALYHALIDADGHILERASLGAYYSAAN
jgi:Raf kinase inhibitor-like YbhB/YbcL family protein